MLTTISRQAQGCQIYICPWQPVQNMISLVTWPRPSLGKTRIAFYFSYNFSPLSTKTFLARIYREYTFSGLEILGQESGSHRVHLQHYSKKFSAVPQKLTCCQQLGIQLLPKSEGAIHVHPQRSFSGVVFRGNQFSRPLGRHLLIECHTYSVSYASKY